MINKEKFNIIIFSFIILALGFIAIISVRAKMNDEFQKETGHPRSVIENIKGVKL